MALYIKKHEPEELSIDYERLGFYFDTKTHIGVIRIYVDIDLQVGTVYDFTFDHETDCNTYQYLILKDEGNHIYYITEFYGRMLAHEETMLGDVWQKCDIKKELRIDLEKWFNYAIDYE